MRKAFFYIILKKTDMNKFTVFNIILLYIFSTVSIVSQNTATYDITFTSVWNEVDHNSVPVGGHWSKLVGATHKTNNIFLQIGNLASTGIKNIAESGDNAVFNTEVSTEITNGSTTVSTDAPSTFNMAIGLGINIRLGSE